MALKLTLKPALQVTINPVIHTFIGFLPLNRLEFIEKIKDEVESNPMIEFEPTESVESDNKIDDKLNYINKRLERADSSFLTFYEEQGFFKKDSNKLDKNRAIELFTSSEKTLADHLIEQASSQFTKKELLIAKQIIFNLNRNGYLDVEIESIASSINSTPQEIENIRNEIKKFDPLGCGSRTLDECLLSQVSENEENKILIELIRNHLEDLAKSKYNIIMDKLKMDNSELNSLISKIRRLKPRPGIMFEADEIDYAEVDLLLIKENNEYQVKFISEGMPNILLSSYYEQMYQKTVDKKTKSYLKEKNRNANLFIEGINLRKTMILKIAEFLVKHQKDFLDFGNKWKKPLTMKEVARELGYNESTISRAVNNKFMTSEKGIISLKSFFSHGIKGVFGFVHSIETIKDKIQKIIEDEPREKPISDQDMVEKLSALGIKISRRTIRNYREEMNIPNSSKRREKYILNKI